MNQKNIVATIFIKNGEAIRDPYHPDEKLHIMELAKRYNDSGVDKIVCLDLSETDEEHEKNLSVIKEINRTIEVKTCGGGNINRLEDVKKLLYAGCIEVLLNGSKPGTPALVKEAAERFGKEKILVSIKNIDFIFKARDIIKDCIHEFLVLDPEILPSLQNEDESNIPYIILLHDYDLERIESFLRDEKSRGVAGLFIDHEETDFMQLKAMLSDRGIRMDNFEPQLKWSDLKTNADGLIPVVVQDYQTDAVLMLAYMNEEAFLTTIRIGKMTYWSRSRNELWTKGLTSGHIQYVKSLTADCDFDTILAKVSQVGGIACHTGRPSCFYNDIIKKEYVVRNPLKVFDEVFAVINDRKEHPREGSYTNYLFDKGIDKILKKVGEEAAEIIIAAKNTDPEESIYEISDFLYHLMVLMAEKNLSWEDITRELAQR